MTQLQNIILNKNIMKTYTQEEVDQLLDQNTCETTDQVLKNFFQPKDIKLLEHYLKIFTENANAFFSDGNIELCEYWKGQVMGICKVIDLLKIKIDTKYWLNQIS